MNRSFPFARPRAAPLEESRGPAFVGASANDYPLYFRNQISRLTRSLSEDTTSGVGRHAVVLTASFAAYLILNRPEVIVLSKLGTTAWYPAAGLAFAIMLGLRPAYMVLFTTAGALAGIWLYHQPFFSWGTLVGAPLEAGAYAYIAYLLRSVIQIDSSLGRKRDVLRYLSGALSGALISTAVGVTCLWADHSITLDEYWAAARTWYLGDAIALFSVCPFLLIHVVPAIRRWLSASGTDEAAIPASTVPPHVHVLRALEFALQYLVFAALLFFVFAVSPGHYYYLAFVPVIWIASRHGTSGAVTSLLILNFGIAIVLSRGHVPQTMADELGGLMLVVSVTGLILGSVITERHTTACELKERTSFLDSLIEHSPFGIAVVGSDRKVLLINDAFSQMFQYRPCEIVGRSLENLIIPPEHLGDLRELTAELDSGRAVKEDLHPRRKDGARLDVSLQAVPLFDNGRFEGGYLIFTDTSEQTRAAAAARDHQESMQRWVGELELRTREITILNEMSGFLQSAETSHEVYAATAQCLKRLFPGSTTGGIYSQDTTGDCFNLVASWGTLPHFRDSFPASQCWSVRQGQPHWSEPPHQGVCCPHVDGSSDSDSLCVPMVAHGETIGVLQILCGHKTKDDIEAALKDQDTHQRLAMAAAGQIAFSISNLRLRDSLREQAIRDPLTGLYNRRFLQEALHKELTRAGRKQRSLAVILLDIDHFKMFNDRFGHGAGDDILKSMADLLRAHFRTEDIICRYGGEEFAVLLPEAAPSDARARAEGLRIAAKERKHFYKGRALPPVTLSAGVAGFPEHREDAQALLELADRCLYRSKEQGRDQVTVADS